MPFGLESLSDAVFYLTIDLLSESMFSGCYTATNDQWIWNTNLQVLALQESLVSPFGARSSSCFLGLKAGPCPATVSQHQPLQDGIVSADGSPGNFDPSFLESMGVEHAVLVLFVLVTSAKWHLFPYSRF